MRVPVSRAKGQLLELIRRAEAGEDVELTRRGQPVARLVRAARPPVTPEEKRRILLEVMESARGKVMPGPDAAHSQDFLYDEDGLPA